MPTGRVGHSITGAAPTQPELHRLNQRAHGADAVVWHARRRPHCSTLGCARASQASPLPRLLCPAGMTGSLPHGPRIDPKRRS
eukprot:3385525-Alexandrium_andersonii.AAC.1